MRRRDSLLRQTYSKILESEDPSVEYVLDNIKKLSEGDLFLADYAKAIEDAFPGHPGIKTIIGTMIENKYYDAPAGERSIVGAAEEVLSWLEQEHEGWVLKRKAKEELYKDNPGINIDIGEATDDDNDEGDVENWRFEDDPSDERNVEDYFAYGNMVAMFKNRVDAELNNSKSPFRIALEKFVSNNGPWPRSLHDAIESFLLVVQKHDKFDLNDPDSEGMTSRGHLQRWWDDSIENYYQILGTPGAIARAKGVFNTLFLIWCKKLDTEMKVKDTLHSDNPGVNIDI